MMTLILSVLLLSIIFTWLGKRKFAIQWFVLGFAMSIVWFHHHITSSIGLSL